MVIEMTAPAEPSFPVRAVVRATGLSEHTLRAWERRYGVVEPIRSPGGSRRYRLHEVERLRWVKAAIDRGHRVGDLARLGDEDLRALIADAPVSATGAIDRVLVALEELDQAEAERLIGAQLSALGPVEFCTGFASPLLGRIGDRWAAGGLCIASEHLGAALIRSALGGALRARETEPGGPVVVVAALQGERHELGLLMASIALAAGGANPCLLGADLPAREVAAAAVARSARAVAVGVTNAPAALTRRELSTLERALPAKTALWLGGPAASALEGVAHARVSDSLHDLGARARLLAAA